MAAQDAEAAETERRGLPGIQPYFDDGLDRPFDEEHWRIGHSFQDQDDAPEIPRGIIAMIGRFGLRLDSSGAGPAVTGLAWSPSPSVSFVAGGSLSGGIGASLSVRLSF